MIIDQENINAVLADSHDMNNGNIPEPYESWSLKDFEDLIPQSL